MEELVDDLRVHCQMTDRRNLREVDNRLIPLKSVFVARRASTATGALLTDYIQRRQAATVAKGTINRELSDLGTAFSLGREHHIVVRLPIIQSLKGATPWRGLFEEADFPMIRARLLSICKPP